MTHHAYPSKSDTSPLTLVQRSRIPRKLRRTHPESRIAYHASRITHRLSRIQNHASPITHPESPITNHQSPITNTLMIAILLCAGFGTRMYPLTKTWPKPLLDVAGKPVIDYLMEQLVEFPALEAIHLVSNNRFYEHFIAWQEAWQPRLTARGIQLTLHNDGVMDNQSRLGAVGDLGLVLNAIEMPKGALVAAGDNILRFHLLPIWQRFLETRQNYVIALRQSEIAKLQRTGVLELDEAQADRVLKLHEKPQVPPSEWTCPAFYFLQPSALERVHHFLKQPDPPDAPGHFIASLVSQEAVYAFKTNGKRFDIGSMEDYRRADRILGQEAVISGF